MKKLERSYPLGQHEELRPIIADLVWLDRRMRVAHKDAQVSPQLFLGLMALRQTIAEAFWERLYAVSHLHGGQRLRMHLNGGSDPCVVIESDDGAMGFAGDGDAESGESTTRHSN